MGDMDRIRDGLYLGSLPSSNDVQQLKEHGISHILTLNSEPVRIQSEYGLTIKYIHCFDIPQADLLSHFEECFQFIDEALSIPNQAVLVHCAAGVSRSATIVISYLMFKEKLTLQDASESVRKCRPSIRSSKSITVQEWVKTCKLNFRPNEGFQEQLRLFECMGSEINKDHELYRRYRLQVMAEQIQAGDTEMISKLHNLQNGPADLSTSYYKCAKCRKFLFKRSSILSHAVGKGEEAFGWQSKVPKYSISSSLIIDSECKERCDRSIFIEPVKWMASVIVEIEGKLNCPYCSAKLGSFVWYGEKCPCGTWVAPSFHIQTGKVDLVTCRRPLDVINKQRTIFENQSNVSASDSPD